MLSTRPNVLHLDPLNPPPSSPRPTDAWFVEAMVVERRILGGDPRGSQRNGARAPGHGGGWKSWSA